MTELGRFEKLLLFPERLSLGWCACGFEHRAGRRQQQLLRTCPSSYRRRPREGTFRSVLRGHPEGNRVVADFQEILRDFLRIAAFYVREFFSTASAIASE